MPIVTQRDEGQEVYYVRDQNGNTVGGPYNSRGTAQSVDAAFFPSGGSGGGSGGGSDGGSASDIATGIIGGREYAIPTSPLGTIPAAQALMAAPLDLPDYLVAGLSPQQLQAIQLAQSSAGLGQEGLLTGQATTAQALEAARAAGLDPLGGFGEQAQGLIDQGQGFMGQGAGTTGNIVQGIPGLLETGRSAAEQGLATVTAAGERGVSNAAAARSGMLGALGHDDAAIAAAMQQLQAQQGTLGGISGAARQGVDRAVESGGLQLDQATLNALSQAGLTGEQTSEASQAAASVADAARRAGVPIQSALSGSLTAAQENALRQAMAGQESVATAADRARLFSEQASQQLQQAGEFGMGAATSGLSALEGAGREFSPEQIGAFMDPYEQGVVDQVMRDLARQGEIQKQSIGAQAVGAGAFGGSRHAVAEQELARNILEAQARASGQLRSQGFGQAQQAAMSAFEQARQRELSAAGLMGQLGQAGAGSATAAAQAAGSLGLGAEELAQTGALSGAQLGIGVDQFAAANAQSLAQTGLSLEQLSAQTGLSAAELAGQLGVASGQVGLSATGQQSANIQALLQSGLSAEQIAAQTGLSSEQLAQQGIMSGAQLASGQVQQDIAGQQAAGQMGMQGASLGIQAGQTAANIGLQASGQGLQGAQTALQGAGQQAQIGQGIGSLGVQTGQLGLGASGQELAAGQTAAQIGQQQANLGQQLQGVNLQDIAMLQQSGALTQQQDQSVLEAERLTQYQNAMAPYQQVGFLSDVVQGSPMGSTVTQTQPGPSPFSQAAGLMLGGAALYNAFQ